MKQISGLEIIEKYFSGDGYLKGSIKNLKRMLKEQNEVEVTDEVKKYINCYEEKENLEKERKRLMRDNNTLRYLLQHCKT
jgi:IS1 family transposase